MEISYQEIVNLASILYNITVNESEIRQLEGYSDQNFAIKEASNDKASYVLKVVNELDTSPDRVELIDQICRAGQLYFQDNPLFRIPKLIETSSGRLSTIYRVRASGRDSSHMELDCNVKLFQYIEQSMTLKAWIKLQVREAGSEAKEKCLPFYRDLGAICGQLTRFLRTQQHLCSRIKHSQDDVWQLSTCFKNLSQLADDLLPRNRLQASPDPEMARRKRSLVDRILKEWESDLAPKLAQLPDCVLHGDLNTKNVLEVGGGHRPYWLIDFQDLQAGPRCVDLAIMMLYSVLESSRLLELRESLALLPSLILEGYQAESRLEPLTDLELSLLPGLMRFRLCQSMLNGLRAFELNPGNKKLLSTNVRGWHLLEMLFEQPAIAIATAL